VEAPLHGPRDCAVLTFCGGRSPDRRSALCAPRARGDSATTSEQEAGHFLLSPKLCATVSSRNDFFRRRRAARRNFFSLALSLSTREGSGRNAPGER